MERSFNDDSTQPCTLRIVNSTQAPIQLLWVNFEGAEQLYNVIESGQEVMQGE